MKNKIVLITGASSGIGRACAVEFAKLGANLILTARRYDRIIALTEELKATYHIQVLSVQLDVRDKLAVTKMVEELSSPWTDIDILINNAGLALSTDPLQQGNTDEWDTMIDTNVKGLLYVSRAIIPKMIKRNSGHIINIGSIAGRDTYPAGNVYAATKHAVRALSKSMRIDLLGTGLRVTEIAPGAVETEFSEVRWNDKKRAKDFYEGFKPLIAEDIADAVVYATTRPPHVNVAELVVYPTAQASVHHLHRTD